MGWRILLGVLLALFWSPAEAQAQRRVALIIGISDYATLSKLSNPVTDAKAIAAALKSHGFEVTEYHDLPRAEMLDALETFGAEAERASVALVYYAGHGMEVAGKNVLAPRDMEIDCEKKTPRRAVDLDQLFSAVSGAPQQIVLLDACRNDPFPQCPARSLGGGSGFRGFSRIGAEDRSLLIANSTLGGQLAADGAPGQHSPFAAALLSRFAAEPGTYLRDLLEAAAGDVQKASKGAQVPEILTRGGAVRICLDQAKCGVAVAFPAPTVPPAPRLPVIDPAFDAWNAAKDTDSIDVLDAYIGKFGESFYASLAKARLAQLRKEQSDQSKPQETEVAVLVPPRPAGPASLTELATITPKGQLRSPYPNPRSVAAQGHKLYLAAGCNGCHGSKGGGGMCPPLVNSAWSYGKDDDTLFRLIALGTDKLHEQGYVRKPGEVVVGPMPPFGSIIKSEDDLWKIIAWIRTASGR